MITHRRDLGKIIDLSLPAAEIGVAEGYFSADILSWGVSKLYMVDAWRCLPQSGDGSNPQEWHDKNYHAAVERVKDFGRAVILRGMSVEMSNRVPDNTLGFVNVDCNHSYDGVRWDIVAWWPKLVKGGVMAFHDYENRAYGVKRAVEEFAANKIEIHLLPEDKPEDAGAYLIK